MDTVWFSAVLGETETKIKFFVVQFDAILKLELKWNQTFSCGSVWFYTVLISASNYMQTKCFITTKLKKKKKIHDHHTQIQDQNILWHYFITTQLKKIKFAVSKLKFKQALTLKCLIAIVVQPEKNKLFMQFNKRVLVLSTSSHYFALFNSFSFTFLLDTYSSKVEKEFQLVNGPEKAILGNTLNLVKVKSIDEATKQCELEAWDSVGASCCGSGLRLKSKIGDVWIQIGHST